MFILCDNRYLYVANIAYTFSKIIESVSMDCFIQLIFYFLIVVAFCCHVLTMRSVSNNIILLLLYLLSEKNGGLGYHQTEETHKNQYTSEYSLFVLQFRKKPTQYKAGWPLGE